MSSRKVIIKRIRRLIFPWVFCSWQLVWAQALKNETSVEGGGDL